MRKLPSNLLLVVTLLLAAGLVAFILWRSETTTTETRRLGFQDADTPLTLAKTGAPDHRFDLPSAWEAARIPAATRFGHPLGPFSHRSGKFGEGDPPLPGDFFEGIGGGNTGLGDPVFSIADGLVLHAGPAPDEWGNVIVLGHRTADGQQIQSLYASLHEVEVRPGDLVPLGTRIGTVGTAEGRHPPRLHFQIHRGEGFSIPPSPAAVSPRQVDPSAFLAEMEAAPPGDFTPSPLARAITPDAEPWTTLEIQGAERLSELSGEEEE